MSIDKGVNLDMCSVPNIHVKTGKVNDYVTISCIEHLGEWSTNFDYAFQKEKKKQLVASLSDGTCNSLWSKAENVDGLFHCSVRLFKL